LQFLLSFSLFHLLFKLIPAELLLTAATTAGQIVISGELLGTNDIAMEEEVPRLCLRQNPSLLKNQTLHQPLNQPSSQATGLCLRQHPFEHVQLPVTVFVPTTVRLETIVIAVLENQTTNGMTTGVVIPRNFSVQKCLMESASHTAVQVTMRIAATND